MNATSPRHPTSDARLLAMAAQIVRAGREDDDWAFTLILLTRRLPHDRRAELQLILNRMTGGELP